MNKDNLSGWTFKGEISEVFDQHVRQSVPGYVDIQNLVSNIADFFLDENPIYDLGCATGETIININNRHVDKKIHFIGIDSSEDMVEQAKVKTNHMNNVLFENRDLTNYEFNHKSNLILSILTLQFCPQEERKKIINKIYETLNTGGAFILVEKNYASSSIHQDLFTQIYHDFKQVNTLSTEEIRDKDKALRSKLVPKSMKNNLELLNQVGFTTDIFYKNLNFTGYLAIKEG